MQMRYTEEKLNTFSKETLIQLFLAQQEQLSEIDKKLQLVLEQLEDYHIWWRRQAEAKGEAWKGDELQRLFVREDGQPILPQTVNSWVETVASACGLPPITPHSLRHTFATLQITAGVDVRTLQARTGHAQASTLVNIYSHVLRSAQKRAADTLENMLALKQAL